MCVCVCKYFHYVNMCVNILVCVLVVNIFNVLICLLKKKKIFLHIRSIADMSLRSNSLAFVRA
jgi:hypothetical protein